VTYRLTYVTYFLEALTEKHATDSFDCGIEALNTWLKEHACDAQLRRTARVFVWHAGDDNVVAYFSLSAHVVKKDDVPNKLSHGSPAEIPAILLGKLGLDKRLHGTGLGAELLHSALYAGCEATQFVGARLFVVDALNEEVAKFYKRYKFRKCLNTSLRLARKISDIQKELSVENLSH
jgi:predicted GNAT family N-acyltransferase